MNSHIVSSVVQVKHRSLLHLPCIISQDEFKDGRKFSAKTYLFFPEYLHGRIYVGRVVGGQTKIVQKVFPACLRDTPSKIIATVSVRYSSDRFTVTIYDLTRSGFSALINRTSGSGRRYAYLQWRTFYGKIHFVFC